MKVLIVEDEMLIAQVTKMQLEKNGFEVLGIASDESAFWKLMKEIPEVILMDVKLRNNESGIELAKKLKMKHDSIPIIFTTGNSRKFVEQEIDGLSGTAILNKPLVYKDLIEKIDSLTARA